MNMSPLLDNMESEWHAQLRSMREAIAELKLDQKVGQGQGYGHDIIVDSDDVTGGSGSGDIWDVWSEGEAETEDSSDVIDGLSDDVAAATIRHPGYNRGWLQSRCASLAKGRSGLDASQLDERVSTLLASDMQGMVSASHSWGDCS